MHEPCSGRIFPFFWMRNRILAASVRHAFFRGRTRGIPPKPRLWRGVHQARGVDMQRRLTWRQTMQKGTVKWFNPTKGYGFIQPSGGDKDVFVHISAVERAGLSTLNEGQTLEFELVTNRGRTSAENLRVS
jgi:CspA family cold shock protein